MLYFDRPGLILLVALATFGPLAGYAIVRWMNYYKTPTGWDAFFSFLTLAAIDFLNGLVISAWIAAMYDEYKKMSDRDGERVAIQPTEEKPTRTNYSNGQVVYQNDAQKVSIDVMKIKAKRCCRTLINQREQGFKVDLREKVWKAQFGGRDNFVYFRDVYMAGAFAKVNPELTNSPFDVAGESGWRVVEAAANGRM